MRARRTGSSAGTASRATGTAASTSSRPRLIEHIELTLIALVVGFVIAFALALVAYRARWLAAPITFVASLLYTIPSLATFFILVPITGINWWTVEIALTSYTLLTLFTNTLAGLNGVSGDVRDAATGIGLTKSQLLWRVELPLAVPAIIAGVRVAAVTTISLATVAAAVVPAGLGQADLRRPRLAATSTPRSSRPARSRCCSRCSPTDCSSSCRRC